MLRAHPEQKQPMSDRLTKTLTRDELPMPQTPMEEIDEATEILLTAKQEYLENKLYTTPEDDFELELLKDPSTRLHASRITELAFKGDRTPLEKYELDLYEKLETRPYAFRIMALKNNQNRTEEEEIEFRYLVNPLLRSYAKEVLELVEKHRHGLNFKEDRLFKLLLNASTFKNAHEIIDLEQIQTLNSEQVKQLSIDYLCKIAEVSCNSKNDFHKDYRSHSFNPATDCVFRDATLQTYNPEVARFRTIEDAFNNAAKKLVESYLRQAIKPVKPNSALTSNSLFGSGSLDNQIVSAISKTREQALALALEKIFFDNDVPFSQKNLDIITDYLNDLIVNQKLALNSSQYKELGRIVNSELIKLVDEPEPVKSYKM